MFEYQWDTCCRNTAVSGWNKLHHCHNWLCKKWSASVNSQWGSSGQKHLLVPQGKSNTPTLGIEYNFQCNILQDVPRKNVQLNMPIHFLCTWLRKLSLYRFEKLQNLFYFSTGCHKSKRAWRFQWLFHSIIPSFLGDSFPSRKSLFATDGDSWIHEPLGGPESDILLK